MSNFWQKLNKPNPFPQTGKPDEKSESYALDRVSYGHNFWKELGKPIFCLAPMEEVTDVAFREMFARYSGGHYGTGNMKHGACPNVSSFMPRASFKNNFVMFTEFINVDGLTHPEGRKNLAIDLKYTENQRPIVAQLWGRSPLKFEEAAKIIADLGFDGIDINMGCPQDKEIKIGACASLIKEPQLAVEIIKFTKKGAGNLPVSVKTRIGYNKNELGTWLRHLLSANPAAITIHGRTKQEKSKVPADWTAIAEAVRIRDEYFPSNPLPSPSPKGGGKEVGLRPLIIGNGDVKSRADGLERVKQTGVDGVMIGRGAFGNPWLFNPDVVQAIGLPILDVGQIKKQAGGLHYITPQEKLLVMLEHARLFNEFLGGQKSFVIMRKHFKAYCAGFDGAHELRAKLLNTKDLTETEKIVENYLRLN